MKTPEIVTLCGSTKFYSEFQKANYEFTMKGLIVLSVGFYPHAQNEMHGEQVGITPEQKEQLDMLHFQKIRISNRVFVLNKDGYIGFSTAREIAFAAVMGLPIGFLEEDKGEEYLEKNRVEIARNGIELMNKMAMRG